MLLTLKDYRPSEGRFFKSYLRDEYYTSVFEAERLRELYKTSMSLMALDKIGFGEEVTIQTVYHKYHTLVFPWIEQEKPMTSKEIAENYEKIMSDIKNKMNVTEKDKKQKGEDFQKKLKELKKAIKKSKK